jgi:hypothetical protein
LLRLPDEWASGLVRQPESGMGYQVATVCLRDGSRVENVVIRGGYIVSVGGATDIPFSVDQIASIKVLRA